MTASVPARAGAPAWNPLAVAAFVLSLVGLNVIPIVLAAIALTQLRVSEERGRGLAIAAIWISLAAVILAIVLFAVIGLVITARNTTA